MELILAESESEVKLLCKRLANKRSKWIALSPFAIVELEKLGIPFDIVDDYYTSDELWDATGWNTLERVNGLIKLVDDFLKERNQKSNEMGLDVLNCYKHQLIMLFDGVIGRIFILKRLIKALEISNIYICKRRPGTFSGFGYLFNPEDTVWGDCLSLKGWNCGVEYFQLDGFEDVPKGAFGSSMPKEFSLRSLVRSNKSLYNFASYLKKYLKLGPVKLLKRYLPGKKLLLLTSLNGWVSLLPLFIREGYVLDCVNFNKYITTINRKGNSLCPEVEVIAHLQDRKDYREKFIFEGTDFYPLLKDRIEKMILDGISKLSYIYEESKKCVKKNKPQTVLTYQSGMAEHWMFLQCMRKEGVPIILWSEGPLGFYNSRKFMGTSLLYTDYVLCFGNGAAKTYNTFRDEYNFQPILWKSADFTKLKKETRARGTYILYATTNYYQHNIYFAWYPGLSDIKLYYVQKTILGYLDKLTNEDIIFKMHPNLTYRKPPIHLTSPRIKKVQNAKTFVELVKDAKVIILDCPNTTLLQAAATNKPIFALMKFFRYYDEALALLKKRAVCADEPEDLVQKLDCYLRTGEYCADVNNHEFIKAYGTHIDEGSSAELAVKEVLKIVE